jgi:hypothetical protein
LKELNICSESSLTLKSPSTEREEINLEIEDISFSLKIVSEEILSRALTLDPVSRAMIG